jgi:catalase
LTNEDAAKMPANGAQKDLVEAIDRGDFPSWRAEVQLMTESETKTYRINTFDLTKIWPYKDFPVIEIGKLELNKNLNNYFAENEQVTFAPSNFVLGIKASPDKMLQCRLLAFQDAHRYRIGANFNQIPVHTVSASNFYPNDRAAENAPVPGPALAPPLIPKMLG